MEEADALCSHIYIMSAGHLKCGGSPIFLKRNFGSGFYLNIEKLPGCKTNDVVNFVKKDISDAVLLGDSEFAIDVGIPFGNDSKFASLFEHLDEMANSLNLGKYGMTLTTLEDVFIKMSMDYDSEVFGSSMHKSETNHEDEHKSSTAGKCPESGEQNNENDFNDNNVYNKPPQVTRAILLLYILYTGATTCTDIKADLCDMAYEPPVLHAQNQEDHLFIPGSNVFHVLSISPS